MNYENVHSHYLNRDTADYKTQVQRARLYAFSSQIRYFGLVTRKHDGAQVRVSLETLRFNMNSLSYKFQEWLDSSRMRGDAVGMASKEAKNGAAAAVVGSTPNSFSIETNVNVTVKVKIDRVLTGSRQDVADKLRDIIIDLENALDEVED